MKIVFLPVVCSVLLTVGCVSTGKEAGSDQNFVTPKESFSIGAFIPSRTKYNTYNEGRMNAFLASVNDMFSEGDVVAVDGLKWQKRGGELEPIPNPPIPVFKQGDNVEEHIRRYAEWIDNHPHFRCPPLPIENKQ